MSTLTLPRPKTRPAHDFNPVVHHYYRGSDVDRAQITGNAITALCGDSGRISTAATGKKSNGALVVCPMCAIVYAELPKGRHT